MDLEQPVMEPSRQTLAGATALPSALSYDASGQPDPCQAACAIYQHVIECLAEGLVLSPRQYRGLNVRRALAELEDAQTSARRVLEATPTATGTDPSASGISTSPDEQALAIYEEHIDHALAILTPNQRKTGESAQPARRGAAREMWEALRRVREVREREAQRLAEEASRVAPGSDHYLRAHAFVPFSGTGWIHRHLGFRLERQPNDTDATWRAAVIRLVECIPPEAHRPGPGHYDPPGTTV